MEEYIQVSAKTKNEAITKAAIELGTASDELDIIVVSEGSSGFFGIGSKPAIIKARKKAEEIIEEESLKELEKENARLKRLVADLSLDNAIWKDINEGKL